VGIEKQRLMGVALLSQFDLFSYYISNRNPKTTACDLGDQDVLDKGYSGIPLLRV
jgi:hypothetical protein